MKQNMKMKHEKKDAPSEHHPVRSMDELRLSAERIRQRIEAEGQKHTDSGELQREERER